MKYYFNKITNYSFDEAIEKITEELKKEGFGVLTEIDVQATLKKKLDVDFKKYKILGVCNPPSAYKALSAEDKIGTMLPCNVIVQQISDSQVEIAAINPIASMQAVENKSLAEVASKPYLLICYDLQISFIYYILFYSDISAISNSVCLYLLQKSKSEEAHMKASMIFTTNDVIINVGVILAGVLVLLTQSKYPDLIVGSVVFLIVLGGSFRILKLGKY